MNIQSITKDENVKFKFIDNVIAEWQNPSESKNKLKKLKINFKNNFIIL